MNYPQYKDKSWELQNTAMSMHFYRMRGISWMAELLDSAAQLG